MVLFKPYCFGSFGTIIAPFSHARIKAIFFILIQISVVFAKEDLSKDAVIGKGVTVGKDALICSGAVVGNDVSIGDNSKVFYGVEIPAGSNIPKDTYAVEYPTTSMLLQLLDMGQLNEELVDVYHQ